MLPDPLHPAVVHFPVVLTVLLPLLLLAAAVPIHRTGRLRLWWISVALAAAVAGS